MHRGVDGCFFSCQICLFMGMIDLQTLDLFDRFLCSMIQGCNFMLYALNFKIHSRICQVKRENQRQGRSSTEGQWLIYSCDKGTDILQ